MQKKPKKITQIYLERAALHYLARFASSSGNLRKILTRKIWKRGQAGAEIPPEAEAWIDELLEKLLKAGLVDDRQYALMRAKSFQQKGRSLTRVKAELNYQNIDGDIIEETLQKINPDGEADLRSAVRLAKKRGLGRYSKKIPDDFEEKQKLRQKHLAIMARSGFSFQISKRALNEDEDDLLD